MHEYAGIIKRNIVDDSPLLCMAAGVSGAVVFTRSIADAVTASVITILAMVIAAAASSAAKTYIGGEFVVFFSTAAAVVAVCGFAVMKWIPLEWERIGVYCPLFAAGSLAAYAARTCHDSILKNIISSGACAVGYGVSLVAVAVIRTAASGMPFFATAGGALIATGILAAVYGSAYPRVTAILKEYMARRTHESAADEASEDTEDTEDTKDTEAVEAAEDAEDATSIEDTGNTEGAAEAIYTHVEDDAVDADASETAAETETATETEEDAHGDD